MSGAVFIENGVGNGVKAKVHSDNRLATHSFVETEALHAVELGEAFNINTGNITYSAAGAMLYIKNNESQDIVVEAIAIGIGQGTTSDMCEITISQNPTGGDVITDETAVPMNANRNFLSKRALDADVYKGKSGGTITGQQDTIFLYSSAGGRGYFAIDLVLPKGTSMAIHLDPKLSSGSVKAYCAAIVYLKDEASKDK